MDLRSTLRWRESIIRHEHYLASKLNVGPGKKVLDVGCGVGGPLREIAAFTGASVTGLNNNEFQVGGVGAATRPLPRGVLIQKSMNLNTAYFETSLNSLR